MVFDAFSNSRLEKWISRMFVSFFPRPKLFFWSALIWTALSMGLWYGYVNGLTESAKPGVVGVALFWSAPSLWFDLYFLIAVAIFAGFWMTLAPHRWATGPSSDRH